MIADGNRELAALDPGPALRGACVVGCYSVGGVRVLQAAKAVNESRADGRGRKQENEKIFHVSFDISHLSFIARHEGLASMFVWPFDSKPHLDAVLNDK